MSELRQRPTRSRPLLKLDEDTASSSLLERLSVAGFDVHSVNQEGLSGADDSAILFAASAENRVLVTKDKGMGDPRRPVPPGCSGIVRMSLRDGRPSRLSSRLLDALASLEAYAGLLHVVRDGDIRTSPVTNVMRRPR